MCAGADSCFYLLIYIHGEKNRKGGLRLRGSRVKFAKGSKRECLLVESEKNNHPFRSFSAVKPKSTQYTLEEDSQFTYQPNKSLEDNFLCLIWPASAFCVDHATSCNYCLAYKDSTTVIFEIKTQRKGELTCHTYEVYIIFPETELFRTNSLIEVLRISGGFLGAFLRFLNHFLGIIVQLTFKDLMLLKNLLVAPVSLIRDFRVAGVFISSITFFFNFLFFIFRFFFWDNFDEFLSEFEDHLFNFGFFLGVLWGRVGSFWGVFDDLIDWKGYITVQTLRSSFWGFCVLFGRGRALWLGGSLGAVWGWCFWGVIDCWYWWVYCTGQLMYPTLKLGGATAKNCHLSELSLLYICIVPDSQMGCSFFFIFWRINSHNGGLGRSRYGQQMILQAKSLNQPTNLHWDSAKRDFGLWPTSLDSQCQATGSSKFLCFWGRGTLCRLSLGDIQQQHCASDQIKTNRAVCTCWEELAHQHSSSQRLILTLYRKSCLNTLSPFWIKTYPPSTYGNLRVVQLLPPQPVAPTSALFLPDSFFRISICHPQQVHRLPICSLRKKKGPINKHGKWLPLTPPNFLFSSLPFLPTDRSGTAILFLFSKKKISFKSSSHRPIFLSSRPSCSSPLFPPSSNLRKAMARDRTLSLSVGIRKKRNF
ncbi:hypothetical protein VP01_1683g2 [Puccinia sorghi]|uniref:Uncharacterized protein n=1 Tax=Puccinia sorghi TaxID=27349 RepID=A0A0L6VG08_9BASI|nr:hypothetical protein VP01_1683g2 [Puccinia sorghi]